MPQVPFIPPPPPNTPIETESETTSNLEQTKYFPALADLPLQVDQNFNVSPTPMLPPLYWTLFPECQETEAEANERLCSFNRTWQEYYRFIENFTGNASSSSQRLEDIPPCPQTPFPQGSSHEEEQVEEDCQLMEITELEQELLEILRTK